jgi:hypothetical protein
MASDTISAGFPKLAIIGFFAGFVSTLTFHQMALWLLWESGFAPFRPYVFTGVPPFNMPAVISLAFWGGAWGILFALIQDKFPSNAYWPITFGFGAILPSLVALMIVLPLKGKPMGGGWHWPLLVTAFLINGIWGIGTAGFFKLAIMKRRATGADAKACVAGAACPH